MGLKRWVQWNIPRPHTLYEWMHKNQFIPIYTQKSQCSKKRDPEIAENYRTISIRRALSKNFENLVYKQINGNPLIINRLSNTQYGSRTWYSIIYATLYWTELFSRSKDKNNFVGVSLLDRSKTFDSIIHDLLKTKLKILGFFEPAKYMNISFMSNGQPKILVSNTESDWISLQKVYCIVQFWGPFSSNYSSLT